MMATFKKKFERLISKKQLNEKEKEWIRDQFNRLWEVRHLKTMFWFFEGDGFTRRPGYDNSI